MEFGLNEILAIIDKVKDTDLELFEYQDAGTRIRIKGVRRTVPAYPEPQGTQVLDGRFPAAANPEAAGDSAVPGSFAAAGAARTAEEGHVITSPMVGTFYAASSEKEAPFIQAGDKVEKGQTVGIVEAMKLMNEIESEWSGTVAEILVTNGQMVEFGQPLVRLVG